MKEVMIAIQPYWVFLIIARKMGWKIDKEKTIEVRKSFPKAEDWNRKAEIYCSKDKKSFNLIPREYQPLMKKFLGRIIGEFTCSEIDPLTQYDLLYDTTIEKKTCVTQKELFRYKGKNDFLYGWHITDLKIYDKPRELSEFGNLCRKDCLRLGKGKSCEFLSTDGTPCNRIIPITRPPQSWCYVESLGE